ncbi:hypothetical protein B296_00015803, partial [Ensete ventricosum]
RFWIVHASPEFFVRWSEISQVLRSHPRSGAGIPFFSRYFLFVLMEERWCCACSS